MSAVSLVNPTTKLIYDWDPPRRFQFLPFLFRLSDCNYEQSSPLKTCHLEVTQILESGLSSRVRCFPGTRQLLLSLFPGNLTSKERSGGDRDRVNCP